MNKKDITKWLEEQKEIAIRASRKHYLELSNDFIKQKCSPVMAAFGLEETREAIKKIETLLDLFCETVNYDGERERRELGLHGSILNLLDYIHRLSSDPNKFLISSVYPTGYGEIARKRDQAEFKIKSQFSTIKGNISNLKPKEAEEYLKSIGLELPTPDDKSGNEQTAVLAPVDIAFIHSIQHLVKSVGQ